MTTEHAILMALIYSKFRGTINLPAGTINTADQLQMHIRPERNGSITINVDEKDLSKFWTGEVIDST